ncbi:TetR/AcrR family transcriptional regulator [Edaphobacter sp. 12200R-103]|uniref:TetR/AcrR family transcriptional regulator n=1 Tax=Edaphobacter sp. 12200R-103 TaxID=2703788 RepID=UPI001EE46522|nr:TetR/AcrR family transcriptional regulator [Edaphobacter sp. 12200R-103]
MRQINKECLTGPEPLAGESRGRGRHRSVEAEEAILKAALRLLEKKPLRKVTADEIAQEAGVSKATIYKWWPNKSLVALDAFLARMTEEVPMPDTGSAEQDFKQQLQSVVTFYNSPLGRLFSQFIAEGQSDSQFLVRFQERFLYPRRNAALVMWRRGVERGEIRSDIDPEMVLDLMYGPMIFRLLAGHGSLSSAESAAMVETIFTGIGCSDPDRSNGGSSQHQLDLRTS